MKNQRELKVKPSKLPKAREKAGKGGKRREKAGKGGWPSREKAGDQVVIDVHFESDWLRVVRVF